MPFIGQQPLTGAYHKLDSITTSETATYNLQLNGGDYSPASANHLLVSLNGVIQAPQDSFTVSGTQIIFAESLSSSDVIDFIMAFGDVLGVGVPTDGSVNTNQIANGAVTTDKINDGDITLAKLASGVNTITQADIWRLTANVTSDGDITSNLERADSATSGLIGTGMTESSGVFSFPETGIYLITVQAYAVVVAPNDNIAIETMVTTNNSSYSTEAWAVGHGSGGAGNTTVYSQLLVDVTDISNVKVKFYTSSISSGNSFYGDTNNNNTSFSFIRLGDT